MDIPEIARVLSALGCPAEKSTVMAAQLDKRARQLMEERGQTYEEALQGLLTLMATGMAEKKKVDW